MCVCVCLVDVADEQVNGGHSAEKGQKSYKCSTRIVIIVQKPYRTMKRCFISFYLFGSAL